MVRSKLYYSAQLFEPYKTLLDPRRPAHDVLFNNINFAIYC